MIARTLAMVTILLMAPVAISQQDHGEDLYSRLCTHCHGVGQVASIFLERRYQGSVPAVLEERADLSRELVLMRIRTQIRGMPAFRPTEISDEEANLIADYLAQNGGE